MTVVQAHLLASGPMTTELLDTKLNIPSVRAGLVPRPQLMEKLQAGLAGKLTLVAGPPGFGKTTLVSSWVQWCGRPCAWLSLDKADNETSRFLIYLTAALQKIGDGAGQRVMAILQSPQPPAAEAALTLLINDFSAFPAQAIVVLDDYHLIQTLDIHKVLAFLLDNLPPQLHVVIVSREDPPLPLHRLRSRGELSGVYVRDLRFSDEEATVFLQQTMSLQLSADDMARIVQRTEGWVAGLQLAALSLQDLQDPGKFVEDFAGDDRYIADYLLNEVIKRQPPQVQAFLLKTAVLDRFTASLCDAVLAVEEQEFDGPAPGQRSDAIIEQLNQSNLFIISLDGKRKWYRYHHLFADFLRRRLEAQLAGEVAGIHRRAAAWYEEHGHFLESIEQALAGGDFERAGRLIEEHALATIFERAQWSTLFTWMNSLPAETMRLQPLLNLRFAWALYATGRWAESEPALRETEEALRGGRERANLTSMLGEVAVLRAMVAFELGDVKRSKALADRALALLPQTNKMIRGVAALARGMAHLWDDDEENTHRLLAAAANAAQATGNVTVSLFALGFRTMLAVRQGRLQQASTFYEEVVREGTIQGDIMYGPAGFACVQMGDVLREWNQLEEAEKILRQGIALCRQQTGMPIWIVEGHVSLARVKLATGHKRQAEALMRQAETLLPALPEQGATGRRFLAATHTYRLRYWLTKGEPEVAARWLAEQDVTVDSHIAPGEEMIHLLLARTLMTQGRLGVAERQLRRLVQVAGAATSLRLEIEIVVLQALQQQAKGEQERAVALLLRALQLSQPEGYIRLFVEYGEALARLLGTVARQKGAPSAAGAVLSAMPAQWTSDLGSAAASTKLIEPLKEQEKRILRLMAAGRSNREIADDMFLSVNTIKVYASRLYGKLGVNRRGEAVARARELGLL